MQPYEIRFAGLFGRDYYAFGFWKARVALYAILKSLDLKTEDEVILPGYTCVVVPNAVRYAGATPIYADIGVRDYNLDPASVTARITPRTRVMIVQHTYGIPADMRTLGLIADKHRLTVVEDCAHVLLGSSSCDNLLGAHGKASFFSFQWSKPYTTGLGGMVVTRNKQLAEKVSQIQSQCQNPPKTKKFQLQLQYELFRKFFKPKLYWRSQQILNRLSKLGFFVGSSNQTELTGEKPVDFGWKMSEFQHRTGLQQLSTLQDNSAHRKNLTKYYLAALRRHKWPIREDLGCNGVELLRLPIAVKRKSYVLDRARQAGIEIGSWFESPLHPLKLAEHRAIDYLLGSCPLAESAAEQVINLPLHERVSHDDAEKIVQFIISHASPAGENLN
jgi:dTDP-4-amino-4,6-dideoxygalactose transaminase